MSNNNGGWKPSKVHLFKCPSGQEVYVQRPGPQLALRVSRIPRTFTKSLSETEEEKTNQSPEDKLAEMSDEEQDAIVSLAREVIVAMVVSPKLVLNPKDGELGPDDTGTDFWPLFSYAMTNFFNVKVAVGNEEVEVKDLESFREEPGVSGDGVDSAHISPNTEQPAGDPGLVDGAGA